MVFLNTEQTNLLLILLILCLTQLRNHQTVKNLFDCSCIHVVLLEYTSHKFLNRLDILKRDTARLIEFRLPSFPLVDKSVIVAVELQLNVVCLLNVNR